MLSGWRCQEPHKADVPQSILGDGNVHFQLWLLAHNRLHGGLYYRRSRFQEGKRELAELRECMYIREWPNLVLQVGHKEHLKTS
jgi:hypothetical protein